jgi:uncharacterized ferritin-like protein (DUF455 family)
MESLIHPAATGPRANEVDCRTVTAVAAGGGELRRTCLALLRIADAAAKADAVRGCATLPLTIDRKAALAAPAGVPGRGARPVLVPPQQVPKRSIHTLRGRAALLHSIAHIEANAVDLALDACWRFAGMPARYYRDWFGVAQEEALHFSLLRAHLRSMGFDYGDFPAHNGLWEMAEKTRHDVLARMALVPRLLEARGLDASPIVREKLAAAGDMRACEILDVILRDEIGHVAIGNRWFRHCCRIAGEAPVAAFARLLAQFDAPRPKPPFNRPARSRAGFSAAELAWLDGAAL